MLGFMIAAVVGIFALIVAPLFFLAFAIVAAVVGGLFKLVGSILGFGLRFTFKTIMAVFVIALIIVVLIL